MNKSKDIIYNYEPLWGSWIIDECIGQGSFGKVYKVSREEWGQKYVSAVKLISIPQNENDYKEAQSIGIDSRSMKGYFEGFVKNIVSEIELMYKLKGNSNIVSYEDHLIIKEEDKIGWHILIKMEFVESLTDYISKNQVTTLDVLKIGIDICKALESCGKQSIIHRDIKDDNIFVSKDGNFKLGDFGIAKQLTKSGRAASMRGTPLYMAPEVYKGENYDATVDTYSLGLVMYKLLNKGRLPFVPPYPQNITYKDTEKAFDNRMLGEIPALPIDAQDELGRIVLKAFSYNPSDRYASPQEMRQELERAANGIQGNTNTVKAVEFTRNDDFSAQASLTNKPLDMSIKQVDHGGFNKTFSIFDNETGANKENKETSNLFNDVRSQRSRNNSGVRGKYEAEKDLYEEEDGLIDGVSAEIQRDIDLVGQYISKANAKKNKSKGKTVFPYIAIAVIVAVCGIAFLINSSANKAAKESNVKKQDVYIDTMNYYEEAKKMYDQGHYDSALDLVTMELEKNPKNAEAICLQIDSKSKLSDILTQEGIAYLKENKLLEAQASFDAAVKMYRPNTEAQAQLEKVKELIKNLK